MCPQITFQGKVKFLEHPVANAIEARQIDSNAAVLTLKLPSGSHLKESILLAWKRIKNKKVIGLNLLLVVIVRSRALGPSLNICEKRSRYMLDSYDKHICVLKSSWKFNLSFQKLVSCPLKIELNTSETDLQRRKSWKSHFRLLKSLIVF